MKCGVSVLSFRLNQLQVNIQVKTNWGLHEDHVFTMYFDLQVTKCNDTVDSPVTCYLCAIRVTTPVSQRVRTLSCWCPPEITWASASSLCSAASGRSASQLFTCHMRWGHAYTLSHTHTHTCANLIHLSFCWVLVCKCLCTTWTTVQCVLCSCQTTD